MSMEYEYDAEVDMEVPVWTDEEVDEIFEQGREQRDLFTDLASEALVEADNLEDVRLTRDNEQLVIAEVYSGDSKPPKEVSYALIEALPDGFILNDFEDSSNFMNGTVLEDVVDELEDIVTSDK